MVNSLFPNSGFSIEVMVVKHHAPRNCVKNQGIFLGDREEHVDVHVVDKHGATDDYVPN